MPHNEFRYIAVKGFTAAHPPGSGIEVTYGPGDKVPAGEWGRAADTLTESGKIIRTAVIVADPEDPPAAFSEPPAPSTEKTAVEVNAASDPAFAPDPVFADDAPYPRNHGRGRYELSDGTFVYGQNKAAEAQDALNAAAAAEVPQTDGGDQPTFDGAQSDDAPLEQEAATDATGEGVPA